MNYTSEVDAMQALSEKYKEVSTEIGKVIVGQQEIIHTLLVSIFSGGHCLLIGVPGLAKTLLVKTVSDVLGLRFKRIQFTPDLMPSDILGTEILDEQRRFRFIKGPVFANIILADEINRTPPKTQSALLEAMQELSVTVAGESYQLEDPFFVLATQNPIEQEGTYPLPEAQLDRFMFNLWLDYPNLQEEIDVVKNTTTNMKASASKVITQEELHFFQELVRKVPVPDNVYAYAVGLAAKTRPGTQHAHPIANDLLAWGAGPRASQFLITGAKCHAALGGKFSPDMADVQAVAVAVLRHRLVKNYKAEAEGISIEKIIQEILQ